MDDSPVTRPRFDGVVRESGAVATRNYVGVFVTSNCAATAARRIADHFDRDRLAAFPNVDGVVAFVHELGCGMEMTGEPMDLLRRTIGGTVRNPNVAAAIVLALGCERNNVYKFLEHQGLARGPRLHTIVLQEVGGTANAIAEGIAAVERMLPLADAVERVAVGAEHLVLGVHTADDAAQAANAAHAALGHAADLVIAAGGTVVLSGTRRLEGIEESVAERVSDPAIARKLVERVAWWRDGNDVRVARERQAPEGSARERALAEARRWGRYPLADFCAYAQPVTAKGLVFMDTPAYEAIAATGLMAGGANVLCLVATRGSGFGSVPAPTLKLAADSGVFRRFADDMDLDAGDGASNAEALGRRLFEAILATASGRRTKSETLGVGEDEFVPWPVGLTA